MKTVLSFGECLTDGFIYVLSALPKCNSLPPPSTMSIKDSMKNFSLNENLRESDSEQYKLPWTSLVVEWLVIHLSIQGKRV